MRLDEAETAVARAVVSQHFPKVARNELRNEVRRALVEMQSEDFEEKESLGIRLRTIEGQDEPLIELAAEGTIASSRLRQGLESVTLLKGAIHEVLVAAVAEAAGKPPADLKDTKANPPAGSRPGRRGLPGLRG
ncbi:Na+-transporting NADH:ubiquinone oxidoreductase subunit NqrC [Arthrobacter sp. ES3-54]|nr:Na+-transporting NADH:ubiquinone oxidoreductase subunit NqrC [Arthrobacter sp. ES3-54]